MSHVTSLQGVTIQDEAAMEKAVARLRADGVNCSLVANQKPRVHGYDAAPVCDKVLKLPDCDYDVGFRKQADGSYEAIFDTYGNHVGRQIGASCPVPGTPGAAQQHQMGRFLQTYAEEAARNQMSKQGLTVERVWTDEATGEVAMIFAELE